MSPDQTERPVEVRLVKDVKTCRTCSWFWGGTPPYGPYASFDWTEDYPPQAMRTDPQPRDDAEPIPWLTGRTTGATFQEPGLLHGCRKAPIMTVGINPNMTAWFAYTAGARWAYPYFEQEARFAYYYRHFTIFQESLALDEVKASLDPERRINAAADGWVVSTARSKDFRWMLLEVQYEGQAESIVHEIAWTPEARWVIVQDQGKKEDPSSWFEAGDPLAGVFVPPSGTETQIYENPAGYYQRMLPVLDGFKEKVGLEADLTVGEDVAQHDMIGCASPGWSSKYDMPRNRMTWNCVMRHGWVVSQYLQSRPAVTIIVGGSALAMFSRVFGPFMDLETEGRDIYELLKETTSRRYWVDIDIEGYKLRSRILTPPHFSYGDNFLKQVRLSPAAWSAFQGDFPLDVQALDAAKKIWWPEEKSEGTVPPIQLDGPDDPVRQELTVEGWQVLMAYFIDPYEMMAEALAEEYRGGVLTFDETTGHLARAESSCRFCGNDEWTFPEGCPYGKLDEPAESPASLDAVVEAILAKARAANVELSRSAG